MKGESKRILVPPPPLHDGMSIEGRWRTVRLLTSLSPQQDPIQLEKNVFLQSGGDWSLYESGVYRVSCTLKYKNEEVRSWTAEQVVLEEPEQVTETIREFAAANMPAPPTVECQIKCGRCKSTQVIVEQKQTRGADESMTVFVQCENCGLRWKM
jgi:DNA-directed RNA polymerase subunit M/transcription elongation factor TFIIS